MRAIAAPATWLFAPYVASYLHENRDHYRQQSRELTRFEITRYLSYFRSELLHSVRVCETAKPLREPRLYRLLRGLNLTGTLPLSAAAGITFHDTIVLQERPSPALLFHELVHVAQYAHLGVSGFARQYVHGFLASGAYESIPLEIQAYSMEARFSRGEVFTVAREIEAMFPHKQRSASHG